MKGSLLTALYIAGLIAFISSCTPGNPKLQQYYAQGEQLYTKHCSNCHQKSGKGLGRLYPPLASSDYLIENLSMVPCLMKYGIKGELKVNTISYNKPMPGVISLTDLEVAEIITYITNSWGAEKGIADLQQVSAELRKCE